MRGDEQHRLVLLLGPLGCSSPQHRRTPVLVLQKSHASFRITFRPRSFRSFRFLFPGALPDFACQQAQSSTRFRWKHSLAVSGNGYRTLVLILRFHHRWPLLHPHTRVPSITGQTDRQTHDEGCGGPAGGRGNARRQPRPCGRLDR